MFNEAANVLLSRITRFSKLKRWGMDAVKRRDWKRAKVALARKLAVILLPSDSMMWPDVDHGQKHELGGVTFTREA